MNAFGDRPIMISCGMKDMLENVVDTSDEAEMMMEMTKNIVMVQICWLL